LKEEALDLLLRKMFLEEAIDLSQDELRNDFDPCPKLVLWPYWYCWW